MQRARPFFLARVVRRRSGTAHATEAATGPGLQRTAIARRDARERAYGRAALRPEHMSRLILAVSVNSRCPIPARDIPHSRLTASLRWSKVEASTASYRV